MRDPVGWAVVAAPTTSRQVRKAVSILHGAFVDGLRRAIASEQAGKLF